MALLNDSPSNMRSLDQSQSITKVSTRSRKHSVKFEGPDYFQNVQKKK